MQRIKRRENYIEYTLNLYEFLLFTYKFSLCFMYSSFPRKLKVLEQLRIFNKVSHLPVLLHSNSCYV